MFDIEESLVHVYQGMLDTEECLELKNVWYWRMLRIKECFWLM